MCNCFKLGSNFDLALVDIAAELNKQYEGSKITEFYGSDRSHAFLAARPDFRLPDITMKELASFVEAARKVGIGFNYTMNTIFPGSKDNILFLLPVIENLIRNLISIGVSRITVANPILLEVIRNVSSDIPLEISTIAHIDTVTQIKYYKERYNVDKVCGSLLKNRAFRFLKNASHWCNANGVAYEVMVNEFCGVGGKDYATACVYRDSCYLVHSSAKTKEDAELFNGYPMQHCISGRNTDLANWLRLRFIRPEDIIHYNFHGIYNFKITGRTGSTEYIKKMAEAYMSHKWEGNLLGLWKPLETIYSGESELTFKHPINIPNEKLTGFLSHWTNDIDFDCANEVCGETCRYCHTFYSEHTEEN